MRQQVGDEVGNFDKYACGGVKSWLQERGRVSFLGACFDDRKVSREQPARGQNYWLSEDCKTMEQKSEKNLDGHISMDGSSRRCLADMRLVTVVQIDHDGGLMPIELDVQRTHQKSGRRGLF